MKIKKALAFVLAMALCVAMPSTVFAKDEPAPEETLEMTFTEEELASMTSVSLIWKDTAESPVKTDVAITKGGSLTENMVNTVTRKAIFDLEKSLEAQNKSIKNVKTSIHIKAKPVSDERLEKLLAAEKKSTKAKATPCTDSKGHKYFDYMYSSHRKISGQTCEQYEDSTVYCMECERLLEDKPEELVGVHAPGEVEDCPFARK